LGLPVVVEKLREISLYRDVRIHLEQVSGLEAVLWFEAVLSAAAQRAAGERLAQELFGRFASARRRSCKLVLALTILRAMNCRKTGAKLDC
jgi:hypothetical protein